MNKYIFYHVFTHTCGNAFLVPVLKSEEEIPEGSRSSIVDRIIKGAKYRPFVTDMKEVKRMESEILCPRCCMTGIFFDPLP
ncbi:MAG: hypothetical protein AAB484_02900 [Patescibacteria group bacterium]